MRFKQETIILWAIVLGALGLRLIPIATDLPFSYWHDEANYIETALRFGNGKIALETLVHGALYQMLLFILYGVYFALGRVFGLFESSADFFVSFLVDPTVFYLIARSFTIASGLGTLGLIYIAGTRARNPRVGLLAALFAAFSMVMFQMSFLALADVPSVFLLTGGLLCLIFSLDTPEERRFFYAGGILIGLATATKYLSGFGALTIVTAAFFKTTTDRDRAKSFIKLVFLGGAVTFGGFCLGLPQFVFNPYQLYNDLFVKLGTEYIGSNTNEGKLLFIFTHHLRNGLGLPLELSALGGFGLALYRRRPVDCLLLSFPAGFFLLMMQSTGFAYHLLPAIPFLLLLAAQAVDAVIEKTGTNHALPTGLCLGGLLLAPSLLDSVKLVRVMGQPDTRTIASRWIDKNIANGAVLLGEGYIHTMSLQGPPVAENVASLRRDVDYISANGGNGSGPKLKLEKFDELYGKTKTYDVIKARFMSIDEIMKHSPPYLLFTSVNDNPSGDELSYIVGDNYLQERAAVKRWVEGPYRLLETFTPARRFSVFFPHLMSDDYRQLRERPLFTEGMERGPIITVWGK